MARALGKADGRRGLDVLRVMNLEIGVAWIGGVFIRATASDRGTMLNVCPWCAAPILWEGPEPAPVPRGHCARCDRCGWPLKPDIREGCVLGNCEQRPLPDLRTHCACGAPYASSSNGAAPPPPAKPLTLTKEAVRDLTPRVASPPPTLAPPIDVAVEKEGKR